MLRHSFVRLGLLALTAIAGSMACSSDSGDASGGSESAPTLTPLDQRESMIAGTGIVSVSPEQVSIDGDRVSPQAFDVSYVMRDLKAVTDARMELVIPGLGELARAGVAVQESGSVRVEVGSGSPSLGATVRFRASCPNGASEWYAMGQVPNTLRRETASSGVRITNVSPPSIVKASAMDSTKSDGGQKVFVTGKNITAECTVETQVNGSRVELMNTRFNGPRFEGLLLFRDLGYSPVAPRYLEMRFVVKRRDAPVAAIRKLAFAD